ncbi:MAG: acetyl-CoA hydrolase/transferase C-terminal domain-containing protein [Gammaproteobacteria bacterium]
MKIVEPASAVHALEDGMHVAFPGACAEPRRFYQAFSAEITRFRRLTVCSGLSLGDYGFLERGLGEHFHYLTWQAAPRLRALFRENDRRKLSFVPLRLSDLTRVVRRDGAVPIDAVVVQTTPPLADGTVSLGISVGPNLHLVDQARLVIAEFNSNMPVTGGASRIPLERIDFAIESDLPLATYDTGEPEPRDEAIIEHVLSLVPERANVQLGIGAVPDRVLARLADIAGVDLYSGMLSEGLVRFLDNVRHRPRVLTGELAGSAALYARCDGHPLIDMQGMDVTHGPRELARLERFVSINSAVEIDLQGQSNGETLGATQISGVGGSLDYIEAAAQSPGGVSIIAMPSTTADGKRSKIVPTLAPGSVVTTPRFCVDCVITEYGIARLRGRSLWQRAEALIAIAHPDFRDALAATLG